MAVKSKDIVTEPDVFYAEGRLELVYLGSDCAGRAQLVAIAGDRLCAPVAAVRAAPAGDHVGREEAVCRSPSLAVRGQINELAGDDRQRGPFGVVRRLS